MKISGYKSVANLFVWILAVTHSMSAFGGGSMDGGGGTSYANPGWSGPVLVDLLAYDPGFRPQEPGSKLVTTSIANPSGFSEVKITDQSTFHRVLIDRLSYWQNTAPALVRILGEYLSGTTYLAFDGYLPIKSSEDFGIAPDYFTRYGTDGRFFRVALYLESQGAVISVPEFERLDIMSQAGLLLHEAFRQVQILNKKPIDHSEIIRMTGVFLLGSREEGGFSDAENVPLFIRKRVQAEYRLVSAVQNACDLMKSLKAENPSGCTVQTGVPLRDMIGDALNVFERLLKVEIHYRFTPECSKNPKCQVVRTLEQAFSTLNEAIDEIRGHAWSEVTDSMHALTRGQGNFLTNRLVSNLEPFKTQIEKFQESLKKNSRQYADGRAQPDM